MIEMKHYILVTPARNEAAYLLKLIKCIEAQTIKPARWVIVSDGSTDDTDEIAARAAKSNPSIKLIRCSGGERRSFGSKALAFKAGHDASKDVSYDYIGNLDADLTMAPNYYERILEEMSNNPKLGVASGVLWDKTKTGYRRTISNLNHAVGGVQLWRKDCFDAVGGYRPVTVGGVDSLAELTARMKGWETKSFPDLAVYHHKPVDSANAKTGVRIAYRAGLTEYHIGTHPLFALMKAIRRWKQPPILVGSVVRLFAYGKLWFTGTKRDASADLVAYLKREQLTLIRDFLLNSSNRRIT